MNGLLDMKYAWRLALKSPGHSLLCSLVVGLSVGLTVFSWVLAYSQAFEPLPFVGSDRWFSVQVAANSTARFGPNLDAYTYQQVVEQTPSLDHLGGYSIRTAVLSEGQATVSLRESAISPRLMTAMKVAPHLGRVFDEADGRPGAPPVAILGFDTWKNYFAGDPTIIGKQTRLDTHPTQIIGVMPQGFFSFQPTELWQPLRLEKLAKPSDSTMLVAGFVVVPDGQTEEAPAKMLATAIGDVNRRHPELFNSGRRIALIPGHRIHSHNNLEIVALVTFVAAAVLLLGCVNISLIFFARLLERSRELALRTALGSSRARLLRQCLLESSYVIIFGLLLGFVMASMWVRWAHSIAEFGARILATGIGPNTPELHPSDIAIATCAAVVLWISSTLIPAWRIAKQDAAVVLAGSGKGTTGPGSAKAAGLLVALQVTISCLVLVTCGNLVFAVYQEVSKPLGMNPNGVVLSTYPTVFGARYGEPAERRRYWDELDATIKQRMPAAQIAFASAPPSRPAPLPVAIESSDESANQGALTLPFTAVSDDYFSLLGITVQSGRVFDATDTDTSLNVAVVDEHTVKRFWPTEDPIGKRIRVNPTENGPWLTVVGVVGGVGGRPYRREAGIVYRPLRQAVPPQFMLVAKMPSPARDDRPLLRAAAFAVDRDLPLHNIQGLQDYLDAMNLNFESLLPAFILIALSTVIVAATGVFGLVSRSVARRTQEVGIRRALGGSRWRVTSVFLRQGILYSTVGIFGGALGIVVTHLLGAAIPNVMVGVAPVTAAVLGMMAVVVIFAAYVPTRRAVALEPGDALHYE